MRLKLSCNIGSAISSAARFGYRTQLSTFFPIFFLLPLFFFSYPTFCCHSFHSSTLSFYFWLPPSSYSIYIMKFSIATASALLLTAIATVSADEYASAMKQWCGGKLQKKIDPSLSLSCVEGGGGTILIIIIITCLTYYFVTFRSLRPYPWWCSSFDCWWPSYHQRP